MDFNSFFTVLFTELDTKTDATLNYNIGHGLDLNEITLKGTWSDVSYSVNGYADETS